MFNNILQRKNFSIRRNATKRWKHAVSGQEGNNEKGKISIGGSQSKSIQGQSLSVVIRNTSGMNTDLQKQAVEITNIALDTCNLESEIATKIKEQMDEFTGKTWHVIVGRNFGTHITWSEYVHFIAGKIHILIFQWG
uniref:Dynein light chain n=1 Tax=Meloidogyne incognita TaxID=6306 RepID=A0A914MD06_MELIC